MAEVKAVRDLAAGDVQAERGSGRKPACGCGRAGCHDALTTLATTTDPAARAALRDEIVAVHLDLAYRIAARYQRSGPGWEDVRQVAALALVEAVDRFDPGMGTVFSAFATPTISGTIKRHFRDDRWMVKAPRPVKDLRLRIRASTDSLAQQLRRVPTVADLANHLACSPREISEALRADGAARPLSLDAPVRAAEDVTVAAFLGSPDNAYSHVDNVETLRPLLGGLSEHARHVVAMRFAGGLTQSEIAERIGCSQMHISRLINASLGELRRRLRDRPAASTATTRSRAF
jgi:RNA polymerase sigma-B factor